MGVKIEKCRRDPPVTGRIRVNVFSANSDSSSWTDVGGRRLPVGGGPSARDRFRDPWCQGRGRRRTYDRTPLPPPVTRTFGTMSVGSSPSKERGRDKDVPGIPIVQDGSDADSGVTSRRTLDIGSGWRRSFGRAYK